MARRPVAGDASNLPSNTSSTQLRIIDRGLEGVHAERLDAIEDATVTWAMIDVRVNGHIIPWEMNVAQMRRFLGLPSFPLFDPSRPALPNNLNANANIEDTDHQQSDHDD